MINSLRHRNLKVRRFWVRHNIFIAIVHRQVRADARRGVVTIAGEHLGDFTITRTYVLED